MLLKLIGKSYEAKSIVSFIFQPANKVHYFPGQYFDLTLSNLIFPDPRGPTRHFTLSSSPSEGTNLMITTTISNSGFKQTLNNLPINSKVNARGPYGNFEIHSELTIPQIFLAGGMGIAAFRSIIKFFSDNNFLTPITLIYSCSTPEELVFYEELIAISKIHPNIKFYPTIAGSIKSPNNWSGITGRIDENMLKTLIHKSDLAKANFWVCGPPKMVDSMEDILSNLTIKSEKIFTEKFTGY